MTQRVSIPEIISRKTKKLPVVVLTAYTAPMAHLLDGQVDILLVGDSLGMVLYGMDSTLAVTLEMMIAHGKAVMKGSGKSCVVVDMPFGSYQASKEQAYNNAARVMAEVGCAAVKMEGGAELAETIEHLTSRGIPVMGHVGMQPQRVNIYGGFKQQGRDEAQQKHIMADALAVEKAGAFAMVLEAIPETLGAAITKKISIPTIGIGAGPQCDGQVLVTEDMLGLFARTPGFVKRYAEIGMTITEAAEAYAKDVRAKKFPAKN